MHKDGVTLALLGGVLSFMIGFTATLGMQSSYPQVASTLATAGTSLTADPYSASGVVVDTPSETTTTYTTCPFQKKTGRIIVDFTKDGTVPTHDIVLEANATKASATHSLAQSIPAGAYAVQLASIDNRQLSATDDEPKESWYLEFYDASGSRIAKSNPSRDIQNSESLVIELVNAELTLDAAAAELVARHAAYPSSVSNMFAAPCAALDLVAPLKEPTTTEPATTETAPDHMYRTCPLPPRPDRTIVDFTKGGAVPVYQLVIRADGDKYDAAKGPLATYLQPGVYEVRYASYNGGLETGTSDHEEWFAVLYSAKGSAMVQIPPSRDIPEWESEHVSKVDMPLPVGDTVTRVGAIHNKYPSTKDYTFATLCLSFDRVGDIAHDDTTATAVDTAVIPQTKDDPLPAPKQPMVQQPNGVPAYTLPVAEPQQAFKDKLEDNAFVPTVTVEARPRDLGIDTDLPIVRVSPQAREAREHVVHELDDTPFRVLRDASQRDRELIVNRLLSSAERQATTTATGTPPHPVVLARRSLEPARVPANASHTALEQAPEVGEQFEKLAARQGLIRVRDRDGDGISDYDEEHLYGTNPDDPFTGDSVLTDGERVLLGLDPTSADTEPVIVESPRAAGTAVPHLFAVDSLSYAQRDNANKQQIRVVGTAGPFTFVTLYIYSTPVVITVQADASGRYEYVFDETLEDGSHELYVATVNNTGKIVAKSDPVPFVKTAQAIEFTPLGASADPVDNSIQTMLTVAFSLVLILAIGGIVWIGMHRARREESELAGDQHDEA